MQSLAGNMWKLVEVFETDGQGTELPPPLGLHPMGVVVFEADRMLVAVCDDQPAPSPDARPRIFAGYAGKYRFDGTHLVPTPESASNPDLLKEQIRHMRFDSPDASRRLRSPHCSVVRAA
jgi:Lipocalin-like domain